MQTINKENVRVLDHPIINHNLAIIRDKNSDCERFRSALRRITYPLIYEASANLPTETVSVETPIEKTNCAVFDKSCQLILAPILRAGMVFLEVAQDILPFANVHHIGMYRNEQTLEPVWYYNKIKKIKEDKTKVFVLILDPMLATGNSAIDTVQNFLDKGIKEKNIVFVSLISSPEGISKVTTKYPNLKIVTASLDRQLNSKGYIMPGLGDAGDRIYNTVE